MESLLRQTVNARNLSYSPNFTGKSISYISTIVDQESRQETALWRRAKARNFSYTPNVKGTKNTPFYQPLRIKSLDKSLSSDEGLTLETSAIHQTLREKNIPY